MKIILLTSFIFISALLHAQTKYIAFKSHSGDLDFFNPDYQPDDDYGLPPARMTKLKKLNDSTIVEYIDEYRQELITDTVVNHIFCSNPSISLDSLKKLYPRGVIFEGFEEKKQKNNKLKNNSKTKKESDKNTNQPKIIKESPENDIKKRPVKSSSKLKKKTEEEKTTVESTEPNSKKQQNSLALFLSAIYIFLILSIGIQIEKNRKRAIS